MYVACRPRLPIQTVNAALSIVSILNSDSLYFAALRTVINSNVVLAIYVRQLAMLLSMHYVIMSECSKIIHKSTNA